MFYEKAKKIELEAQRMNAIIAAQAIGYAAPSFSGDKGGKRTKSWQKFINSLSWNKIEEKSKPASQKGLINLFRRLGVPVTVKKGDSSGS